MSVQQDSFQDRLDRISGGTTQNSVPPLIIQEGQYKKAPQKTTRQAQANGIPHWMDNIAYPLSFVRAFFIGVLAVFISRYVRFHLTGGSLNGIDADITMMIDGGTAIAIGFTLKQILRLRGKEFAPAQAAGVAAMVLLMHNIVHVIPDPMAMIFSQEWVEDVTY